MPCAPHKTTGQLCDDCPHYAPQKDRVLVVKLAAMGDVLRSAALLPDIAAKYRHPQITWLTRRESVAMLDRNPWIARVMTTQDAHLLSSEEYDAVYALDSDPEGLAYAQLPKARAYHGFERGTFGTCVGVARGGDATLFEIGVWDDLKRANQRPYLELLAAAAGLTYGGNRPFVHLIEADVKRAAAAFAALPRPLVGVNADASARWERKQWNFEYVEDFVRMAAERGHGVVLFGGAEAYDRNRALAARYSGNAVAFASDGDVGLFTAGIAQCDVLLTGDTLGMHIAWALDVPVVALFGPTSLPEITLGARDRKLAATELPCLGCYLKTCAVDPHCMDRLEPRMVFETVQAVLSCA